MNPTCSYVTSYIIATSILTWRLSCQFLFSLVHFSAKGILIFQLLVNFSQFWAPQQQYAQALKRSKDWACA